ncbi:hypothetical protein MGYG_01842 [Nannizzia gypsea CBS 118893]|uniref:Uncharacterized protein n=1 Tax=Arthroderma gypseum (strain ATCC MYA-4604 / CBS 118893) TaxID=535722 RepID=E5R3Y1_ARTGP|nr:hypothetical protein MGYG_01842 [Nannizzia gypsea CBS 118893]EFQ98827.1 hypothetical protein MGYG_01842 [Nannizzia gypsea CBS 118893]
MSASKGQDDREQAMQHAVQDAEGGLVVHTWEATECRGRRLPCILQLRQLQPAKPFSATLTDSTNTGLRSLKMQRYNITGGHMYNWLPTCTRKERPILACQPRFILKYRGNYVQQID